MIERKTIYFEDYREDNRDFIFGLVEERLKELGIKKLVLASTTGATAKKALEFFKGKEVKIIVVTHQYDFMWDPHPFPQELVKIIRESGHEVQFGTMLFHTENLYESNAPVLMANLLRCFSQGTKVCFEIVLMAADAGHLKKGEKVIAVAGTGRRCDTALVMQAASSRNLKKLRVNEIICKPLNPLNIQEVMEMLAPEIAERK